MRDKSSQSLYQQIAVHVEEIISSRKLQPHEPIPSEGELAKKFGVSRMTAKLALEHLAKKGIVYRLPRRGTFLSDRSEGSLNSGMMSEPFTEKMNSARPVSRTIAIVVSNLDYYTSKIVSAIESEARLHSYNLIVRLSKDTEDEDASLRQLVQEHVDGIILFPRGRPFCSDQVLWLKMDEYPIVIIDRNYRDIMIDSVCHDHLQGMYEMMQYLIGKGHKEIGYVTNALTGISSREERYEGYIKALFDQGIPVRSQYIHIVGATNNLINYAEGNPELEHYIRSNPEMTAIMCCDDYIAASTMYAALKLKIPVPEQLSITGFSDIQIATMLPVPLTTVNQPTGELGQTAAKLLIDRIHSFGEARRTVKIKTVIVERQSVRDYFV